MKARLRRPLRIALAALTALTLAPAGLAAGAKPAAAGTSSPSGALLGLWADQNISTLDAADGNAGTPIHEQFLCNGSPGGCGAEGPVPGQYTDPTTLYSYVPDMNRWQGKANSIIDFYDQIDPEAFSNWAPVIWDDYHAIPMITLDMNGFTNAEIAAGQADTAFAGFAHSMQAWLDGTDVFGQPAPPGGRRVYLRPAWEANGDWYQWAPGNYATDCASLLGAEQDYVAAWRRMHTLVMTDGLSGLLPDTQVAWVFSVAPADTLPADLQGCPNGASDVTRQIYPGDDYVDWTGIDGYSLCSSPSPTQLFSPMVSELRSITSRPLSIDEVGASTAQVTGICPGVATAQKGQWISQFLDYLQSSGAGMSLWFNGDEADANHNRVDWALFSQAADPLDLASAGDCTYQSAVRVYNAYCEYPRGLAAAYFVGADPRNARIVSDTSFLGRLLGSVPSAPVLSATGGVRQVSLTWSAPDDGGQPITEYDVYRGTAPGAESLYQALGPSAGSYLDTAVTPGVSYYYEVRAVNGIGGGAPSNEAAAMPTSVPAAPTGLTAATAPGSGVSLHWNVPSSNGSPITGYELYRGTSPGAEAPYEALPPNSQYLDGGAQPGRTYYYTVAAVNADGTGPPSNEASARSG